MLIGLEVVRDVLLCGGCGESRDGPALCASELVVSRRIRPGPFLESSLGDLDERRFVNEADHADGLKEFMLVTIPPETWVEFGRAIFR